MAEITPRQIQIRDAFVRNWGEATERLREQTEASRHGESNPEFASLFNRLEALQSPVGQLPPELVLFLQASVHAAVATVEQLCGEPEQAA